MGMPVVLSDSVLLTSGQAKNLNGAKMQPASRRAIFVREFVFIITAPGAVTRLTTPYNSFGAFIRVKMKMGAHEITSEPQPIWAMATPRHWIDGSKSSIAGAFVTGQTAWTSFDRWVLPKPMFVPGNANVDIVVSRGTDIDAQFPGLVSSNFEVRVSMIGEYADKIMPVSDVPFVSSFFPEAGRMYSNDRELKNTLDRDVEVQRLIGRVFHHDGAGAGVIGDEAASPNGGANIATIQSLTMKDSKGYYITGAPYGGFASFGDVFPWNGRSWTYRRVLKPNENYHVALGVSPIVTLRPMVSFVASRKERV